MPCESDQGDALEVCGYYYHLPGAVAYPIWPVARPRFATRSTVGALQRIAIFTLGGQCKLGRFLTKGRDFYIGRPM